VSGSEESLTRKSRISYCHALSEASISFKGTLLCTKSEKFSLLSISPIFPK
jgi:hypothetical protein